MYNWCLLSTEADIIVIPQYMYKWGIRVANILWKREEIFLYVMKITKSKYSHFQSQNSSKIGSTRHKDAILKKNMNKLC